MHVKSSGMARGLANAWPPGSAKFAASVIAQVHFLGQKQSLKSLYFVSAFKCLEMCEIFFSYVL